MKRHIFLALSIVVFVSAFVIATRTLFSSQVESKNNIFTAGTLKFGGMFGESSVNERFASINLSGIRPGQVVLLEPVKLKNLGTLPFKLYRITASNIVDDSKLGEKLSVKVKIDQEQVYEGKISELIESNGGYFDAISSIVPGKVINMTVEVLMDQDAGNEYQNKTIKCDFNIFATQDQVPSNGEDGSTVRFGPAKDVYGNTPENTFCVNVQNTPQNVEFAWDWQPGDDNNWGSFEYYILEIKHETGNPTTDVEAGRLKMKVDPIDESTQTIESTNDISQSSVTVDWDKDMVKIRRDVFPQDWKGFEVKISGVQKFNGNIVSIPYEYWSLGRVN